jgi:hypothetical protein
MAVCGLQVRPNRNSVQKFCHRDFAKKADRLEQDRQHDTDRGENRDTGSGDEQIQNNLLYPVTGTKLGANAPQGDRSAEAGKTQRQHRKHLAARRNVFIEAIGSIAHNRIDLAADRVAGRQVLDEQVEFARRHRSLRVGQTLYDQCDYHLRLEKHPEQEQTERRQQAPDQCEIAVVTRQGMQLCTVGRPADYRERAASPHIEGAAGHCSKHQYERQVLHRRRYSRPLTNNAAALSEPPTCTKTRLGVTHWRA